MSALREEEGRFLIMNSVELYILAFKIINYNDIIIVLSGVNEKEV